jgi:DNA mismatch repair protein MutL
MIHKLDDTLIDQIAAGEVIERPVSVVRELVDNALDAGATEITIELTEGGKRQIRVVDNGNGIPLEHVRLAFERFTTSKLSSFSDLETLSTRGFRGEALSSILSISETVVRTRNGEATSAVEIRYRGGKEESFQPCTRQQGTTIEVNNIFFNVPARRKFLKSDRVEDLKCAEWVREVALSSPQVSFLLQSDGKERLCLLKSDSFFDRASELFPGSFHRVSYQGTAGWSIEGRIAHPSVAEKLYGALVVLVNGRVILDRLILRAVKDAFQSSFKERENPVGVISLTIPSSEVDINVHPQKKEVRFANSQAIYTHVHRAVSSTFRGIKSPFLLSSIEKSPLDFRSSTASYSSTVARAPFPSHSHSPSKDLLGNALDSSVRAQYQPAFPLEGLEQKPRGTYVPEPQVRVEEGILPYRSDERISFSNLRYKSQVVGCYLIAEDKQGVVIIDMHAAHERVNFHRIMTRWKAEQSSSQHLALPYVIEVSPEESELIEPYIPLLDEHGFEVVKIDDTFIKLTALPSRLVSAAFGERQIKILFYELTEMLKEESINPSGEAKAILPSFSDFLYQRAALLACHASIKSGTEVTSEEAKALILALDEVDTGAACPHGRPTAVRLTKEDLAKLFFRD